MGALFLLNFVLVAIPIGSTLGVLLGLQSQRQANGQDPLFKPDKPTGPGGKPVPGDNGIEIEVHCDETLGISPPSQGDHYTCKFRLYFVLFGYWEWKQNRRVTAANNVTVNPNPWGWDEGDPGSLCLNVSLSTTENSG